MLRRQEVVEKMSALQLDRWAVVLGAMSVVGCGQESTPEVAMPELLHVELQHAGGASQALMTGELKVVADDGALNDSFGHSVARWGSTVVVSALRGDGPNGDQGAVYVYAYNGHSWVKQAKLMANDGRAGDAFGCSVSLFQDTAIVGACHDNVGPNALQGSAYVFVRNGTQWSQQAKLIASDGEPLDLFGCAVSISNDSALVSACIDPRRRYGLGAAYIFRRNGISWTKQARVAASDGVRLDGFGTSVSLSYDTAIIGAPNGNGSSGGQGSAYIFFRAGDSWTEQTKLTAPDGHAGDGFGQAVSVSNDTALVGAPSHNGATNEQGSAYVYFRMGSIWTEQATIEAMGGSAIQEFGRSVSISGDMATIGRLDRMNGLSTNQGFVHVFVRNDIVWSEHAILTARDGANNDRFGTSVSSWENTVLVGAPGDDIEQRTDQGSAYIFVFGDDCVNMPNDTACDDANPCTLTDTCQNGKCVGTNQMVCPSTNACQQSACKPATGLCTTWNLSDQTPCPGGLCIAGGCYADDSSSSAGAGGAGGISNSGAMESPSTGTTWNNGDENNTPRRPDARNASDLRLRGSGCHCNAAGENQSNRWFACLIGSMYLARKRRIPRKARESASLLRNVKPT